MPTKTNQRRGGIVLAALLILCGAACSYAQDYKSTPVSLANGIPGVLYEPVNRTAKADIAILAMHPDADYLRPGPANPCTQLVSRGYTALCANAPTSKAGFYSDMDFDKLFLNVKLGVEFLRKDSAVKKVILFGHSGGGAMMSGYQNIAERGLAACQDPQKLIKCPSTLAGLTPADGVMLIDASMGMPGSVMESIDPAVLDESSGVKLDPSLDMYDPKNGFNPSGSHYSPEFIKRFFAAQHERMTRLIDQAEQRLQLIQAGKGNYKDDEPMVIPGALPADNKLNQQDTELMQHTRGEWPLLHANGRVTNEVIYTVRVPRGKESPTPYERHALKTTVRTFLSTYSVRTTADYRYDATAFHGVDFNSSYGLTINNVEGISKPLLQMGMTGSYEFFYAETAREHAKSTDKTLAYVEGAVHGFTPCKECAVAKGLPADYYGDTVKTLFDYMDGWLSKAGRFQ